MTAIPRRPSFEEACRQLLAAFQDELPPEERDRICADLRLHYDYRGEYVAYLDTWEGDGPGRRLKREVVAHGRRLDDLDSALAEHRDRGVALRYVDDLAETSTETVPEEVF